MLTLKDKQRRTKMLLTSCETDDKKEENKATAPASTTTPTPTLTFDPSIVL